MIVSNTSNTVMEHFRSLSQGWNNLPEELKLHIAYHVATPASSSIDSTEITEQPSNLPIDLSLRAADRLSRAITLESIANTYAFVKVMIYDCGAGNECQQHILQEFEDAFGSPKGNSLLSKMHDNSHVRLSIITIDLACLNPHEEKNMRPATLAAFSEINHLRTMQLCSLLQAWEPFHVQVNLQTLHKGIGKQVRRVLDAMRNAVTDKQITFDAQLQGKLVTPETLPYLGPRVPTASISTQKQLLAHVRNNTKGLQALLDAGHPMHHLVSLANSLFQADLSIAFALGPPSQHSATVDEMSLKSLYSNYSYIVVGGLSEYLLGQPLTVKKQKHYFFSSEEKAWDLRVFLTEATRYYLPDRLVQESLSGGQSLSEESLEVLRSRYPVLRVRAQFYLALARLKLLPDFVLPTVLIIAGVADNSVKGNLVRAIREMDKIQCILQTSKGQENEGYHPFGRADTFIWLVEMRFLAMQIRSAEDIGPNRKAVGCAARALEHVRKPLMVMSPEDEKLELPYR